MMLPTEFPVLPISNLSWDASVFSSMLFDEILEFILEMWSIQIDNEIIQAEVNMNLL